VAVLGHQVVLEVVSLDVEDELPAGEGRAGGVGLERTFRRDLPETAEAVLRRLEPDGLE